MLEIDRELELETIMGLEAHPFVAVARFDACEDPDEFLRRFLFFDSRGLQQEYERTRAAVHDRYFGCSEVDIRVVDAESSERGHEVLNGRNAHTVFFETRREPRIANRVRVRF